MGNANSSSSSHVTQLWPPYGCSGADDCQRVSAQLADENEFIFIAESESSVVVAPPCDADVNISELVYGPAHEISPSEIGDSDYEDDDSAPHGTEIPKFPVVERGKHLVELSHWKRLDYLISERVGMSLVPRNGYASLPNHKRKRELKYGEVRPMFARMLMDALELTDKDVFYDWGCGYGRFICQTACMIGCKAVGIEVEDERADICKRYLEGFYQEIDAHGYRNANVVLRKGSFLSLDCQEATAVFIHNYSFEAIAAEMVTRLAKLRPGTKICTLKPLCERQNCALRQQTITCDCKFLTPPERRESCPDPFTYTSLKQTRAFYLYRVRERDRPDHDPGQACSRKRSEKAQQDSEDQSNCDAEDESVTVNGSEDICSQTGSSIAPRRRKRDLAKVMGNGDERLVKRRIAASS